MGHLIEMFLNLVICLHEDETTFGGNYEKEAL